MNITKSGSTNSGRGSKLGLALVCGMVCSSVLMLTNHSHASMQASPAAPTVQSQSTVVITAKRMSAMEKAQYRAELAQQENRRV